MLAGIRRFQIISYLKRNFPSVYEEMGKPSRLGLSNVEWQAKGKYWDFMFQKEWKKLDAPELHDLCKYSNAQFWLSVVLGSIFLFTAFATHA